MTCWVSLALCFAAADASGGICQPVIATGIAAATRDKPQSKLWHAHGSWWAWLPSRTGSSIWRRTAAGWKELESLQAPLTGLPASADVESVGDQVYAVLIERPQKKTQSRLRFAVLQYQQNRDAYAMAAEPQTLETDGAGIETATVAVDESGGRIWVAYTLRQQVLVRHAAVSARNWSKPIVVADQIDKDDICSLGRHGSEVFVVWSDQRKDAVECCSVRCDLAGKPQLSRSTIAAGGKLADDHLNIKVARSGKVFIASKNSVDTVGKPQLVLYSRNAAGTWKTQQYAVLQKGMTPSRPIVAIAADGRLFCIHTIYKRKNGRREDFIEFLATDIRAPNLEATCSVLIRTEEPVNDATCTKQILPKNLPWIVLASDAKGNVYEGTLGGAR